MLFISFKFLPFCSVYNTNNSRKNSPALDSKGNWLSCLCNWQDIIRVWNFRGPKIFTFLSSALSLDHGKTLHGLWGEGTPPVQFILMNEYFIFFRIEFTNNQPYLMSFKGLNFCFIILYSDANVQCRDILQLMNNKFWNTIYYLEFIFGFAVQ